MVKSFLMAEKTTATELGNYVGWARLHSTLVARALAATRDVSAWIWTNPVEQTDAKDFLSSTIALLPMVSLHQLLKKQIKWYYDSLA